MPEAREWDVELPKGVFHATEWIAAGFPTRVTGGSEQQAAAHPKVFCSRQTGDNKAGLQSAHSGVLLTIITYSGLDWDSNNPPESQKPLVELRNKLTVSNAVTPIKVLRRGFTLGGARFGRHLLKFLRL